MRLSANFHTLSSLRVNGFVLSLLVGIGATATFASFKWIRIPSEKPAAAAVNELLPQPTHLVQQQHRLEMVWITLRPNGFEPAEVTRPAGRFLLAVNDRSGQPDARFILLRQSGERLKDVRLRDMPRKHEWREVMNLPAGRYLLADAGNPERACQILLTN